MSENFIRKYQLTITGSNGKAVTIRGQHIEFKVSLSSDSKLNELDLKIYNLSRETIAIFDEVDATVKLEVGYADNPLATVFLGNKTYVSTQRDGTEVITQLLAAEGVLSTREARIQAALPENTTVREIISKVVKDSMPEIKTLNLNGAGLDRTYPRGYSVSGGAKKVLDDVCKTNNLRWSISQNTILNVLAINGDIKHKAILITPTMIKNTPEKTTKEMSDLKDDLNVPKKLGLNLSLQMNPLFIAGGLISVQGTFNSDGTYLIDEVVHNGSFEGDTWDTELTCSNY